MGLISGIISEEGIKTIVEKANSNADKAVGDSKFKIPTPETFGVGVFIKMGIRMFESGIIANILPVKQAKDIVTNASPAKLVSKIKELISGLSTLATNPIHIPSGECIGTITESCLSEYPKPNLVMESFVILRLSKYQTARGDSNA